MSNPYTPSESEDIPDSFYTNLPSLNINSIQSSSQQTSPLSPDEMVIRSRGRRKFPSSFSPDRLLTTNPTTTSPNNGVKYTRQFLSPTRRSSPPKIAKPGRMTRSVSRLSASTERVRRMLDFPPEVNQDFSILKLLPAIKKGDTAHAPCHASEMDFLQSHTFKKQKINPSSDTKQTTPSTLQLAKGLSKSQLVDLLSSLTAGNPHLSSSLAKLLPKPDLSGLISSLTYLNQNIYKAIPVTRLSDRTDSLAYKRVATHLTAFKKSIVEDLNMLLEAGQWDSVLDYVIMAWDIVMATPVWDNPTHNTTRFSCFKHMASSVIRVIKQKDVMIGEERKMKLVKFMTGSSVREVQLCKEKLLERMK